MRTGSGSESIDQTQLPSSAEAATATHNKDPTPPNAATSQAKRRCPYHVPPIVQLHVSHWHADIVQRLLDQNETLLSRPRTGRNPRAELWVVVLFPTPPHICAPAGQAVECRANGKQLFPALTHAKQKNKKTRKAALGEHAPGQCTLACDVQ